MPYALKLKIAGKVLKLPAAISNPVTPVVM
jgi:hypothetical protein